MIEEIWKIVPDWPNYIVNNLGEVRRLYKSGNYRVFKDRRDLWLSDKPKRCWCVSIATLVLLAFKGPPPNDGIKYVARHLDDIFVHNNLDNVAWGTYKDNSQDAIRNGKIVKGKVTSIETRLKLSKSLKGKNKGRKHSEEFKEKCRLRQLGKQNRLGKSFSQESRDKISKGIKKKWDEGSYENRKSSNV